MRYLRQVFLKGLFAILPVAVTIYLIVWLASGFESLFGSIIEYLLPAGAYVPGMGLLVGIGVIFGVGLMLETLVTRRLWELGLRLIDRMPLVRSVFSAIKQVVGYVSGTDQPEGRRVVMVTLADPPVRLLGLVTRENPDFLDTNARDATVAVFLPWSYQIGGFTVFVPRSALTEIELTPQEALRLAMTAGIMSDAPDASPTPRA